MAEKVWLRSYFPKIDLQGRSTNCDYKYRGAKGLRTEARNTKIGGLAHSGVELPVLSTFGSLPMGIIKAIPFLA